MVKINKLDENLNIEGKKVLLRVDFNVPINDGTITEDSRIEKALPTIKFLINKKAKIIIIAHLGRPKGKIVPELTLKPIAKKLSNYLNQDVTFLNESIGSLVIQNSKKIPNGKIMLLENIRFHKEEELNSVSFAKELSKIGDIYINEAFPCSHRAHASVCEITKHIDSFAGKQLLEEISAIKMLTDNAKNPTTCIVGGSKISTKSGILINLVRKMQNIVIVGAMANTFLKYNGYNIGQSIFEKNQESLIENIIQESKKNNCNLVLPEDVITSRNHNSKGILKNLDQTNNNDLILDIGEKTLQNIFKVIDKSKTVLWNGPAGYFEIDEFSIGSKKIANKISDNTKAKSLISIAGGGDTVAAINKFKCSDGFTYLSTAGGAFLELLEGKMLPGIKALEIN
ncbi:MAG: phosphoglycerate kinase [Pelagibacteraceae bacterium]|jgi:phosphoglycerate kinase|nr:phosphoglycerate kinase [Pelagibacteraceae bacterium]|tara:strand:+ start:1304 stop:2497 length:1194 start_codon:yes stop_codon:yes gene_type:complete